MFYLSGVAKQAVCLTQQQLQQQQKSQRAFSTAANEQGNFCFRNNAVEKRLSISLNKLRAQWQLLR